jgi:hypothetical protein
VFIFVIASTSRKSMSPGMTGIAVGLMLTLVHLISIPIDNTSVNPARSFGMAVIAGGDALTQLWAFFVFPIAGGVLGVLAWWVIRDRELDVADSAIDLREAADLADLDAEGKSVSYNTVIIDESP